MNRRLLLAVALCAGAALAASAQPSNALKSTTKTKTSDDAAKSAMGEYHGVKHALGVADFTSRPGFFFEASARENMRAMLESALFATNRFVIVERGNLESVMDEQDLQASGRAAKAANVAQTGKLRSARYLASCQVTESSTSTSGDNGGVRIKGFQVGGSSTKSSIVLVVKLVDTTTGEVVASERIRGQAGASSLNLGYSNKGWGGNLGSFAKTPLGEAAQDCINQAVKFIAGKMESMPVEGAVVSVTGSQVMINLGENYGMTAGSQFTVRKKGETLTDPDTGEILGTNEGAEVGAIEVTAVKEKISVCKIVSGEGFERGDVVVLK